MSENINFLQQFLAIPAAQVFGLTADQNGKVET